MGEQESSSLHSGEVLPPDPAGQAQQDPAVSLNQTLLAISNYTDRPDLLIAELERHDPGFVKRMNAASEKDAAENRAARFKFGRFQAYLSVVLALIAALAILYGLLRVIELKLGFWHIVGLAIFYAITQGGSAGFLRIIDSVSEMLRGNRSTEKPPAEGKDGNS